MLQSEIGRPWTAPDTQGRFVILECDDNTAHRNIGKYNVEKEYRYDHQIQHPVSFKIFFKHKAGIFSLSLIHIFGRMELPEP